MTIRVARHYEVVIEPVVSEPVVSEPVVSEPVVSEPVELSNCRTVELSK